MRHIVFLFCLGLLLSCGAGKGTTTTGSQDVSGPDGLKARVVAADENKARENVVEETIAATKVMARVMEHTTVQDVAKSMEFLASDELQGRDSGSEGIAKAAEFIINSFESNGVAPYFETYRDTLGNFDLPAFNVVGILEGSDPKLKKEFIIVGAHYDHIGLLTPENGDAIANGANDNASGTTTVMELAKYFGKEKANKRSIIFALFTAEEKGLMGAKHLANKLKAENLNLYAMLNFEMVGVPMVDKDYLLYLTGYELSNLAQVSNGYADENLVGFLPKAKEFNLFKRSDNYPFHEIFKVPSQTYCTFDFTNFDHYHKVGDENEEMDYAHIALVINKMIPVVEGIANAPVKEITYK
ncbi:M28 family metallopeptidase [Maribacter chungangensis]|uniref:M28 family metallopeptidase n=1 Tax=Maribacter chungangensis TaxID=1069117 RepID=A0ABW3B4G5_9FLAO